MSSPTQGANVDPELGAAISPTHFADRARAQPRGVWYLARYGIELMPEIAALDCYVTLQPRPWYCDRGKWLAHVIILPGWDPDRLNFDGADAWPRYYFDLDRGKLEVEAWLRERRQLP